MITTAYILTGFVALLHLYFLVLEMFFWDKPLGLKTFGHIREFAQSTRILAMNQGLYNGFLAAGLVWGLISGPESSSISIFFLVCIIIAGIFGGITASRKIMVFQALPASLALFFVLMA